MPEITNVFSIVVTGHMNPAIHHPAWYRQLGVLTDAEVAESIGNEGFVVLPQLAQFIVGSITIACIPQRWDIRTTDEEQLDRILDIAIKTHKALDHTPVSAFGLNFDLVEKSPVEHVGRHFGAALQAQVGLTGTWLAGDLQFRSGTDKPAVSVAISSEPRDPRFVQVKNNFHYSTQPPEDAAAWKHFDLGEMIRARFRSDLEQARRNVAAILTTMNRQRGS